ncbi:hypothetical protein A1O1_04225, partial [Capronia coronata CBS 617.96]
VVDYYAPTDFLQMDDHALPGSLEHNARDSPESRYIGGPITENRDIVEKANPITWIERQLPPFFIAYGTEDRIVPLHQSELLVSALEKVGARAIFHPVDRAEHGFQGSS